MWIIFLDLLQFIVYNGICGEIFEAECVKKALENIFIRDDLDASIVFTTSNPEKLLDFINRNEVNVLFLDINLKSRCIEYVYDCILNKYETITLGSYTKNFFTKTQNTNTTLDSGNLDVKFSGMVNDILQQTQKHLNDTITSAMGGYVYKTNNALYIMDTDDISTAQKIWTWNKNG